MVERVKVVVAALAKESAATPAAPPVMLYPQGMEARPQEVPVPSAGLTPPAPILVAAARAAQPPKPRSFLLLRFPLSWHRGRLLFYPSCSWAMAPLPPPGPWRRQERR